MNCESLEISAKLSVALPYAAFFRHSRTAPPPATTRSKKPWIWSPHPVARVRKPSLARSAAALYPCARRRVFFSDPARITTPCAPPCRSARCVNRLFHPYLLSVRYSRLRGAARRGTACTPTHRRRRRRRRGAREEKVTWVIWPFRARACARLTWRVSRHGDSDESAAV